MSSFQAVLQGFKTLQVLVGIQSMVRQALKQSTARQVPVEDAKALHYGALTSQFAFLLSKHQNPPSARASSRRAASHHSQAESDEEIQVEQPPRPGI